MQGRNETMAVGNDEAQRGPAEPTTRERTPRFKLIKLEERIAPGRGPAGGPAQCTPYGSGRPATSDCPI
jgi:hypothetical protein